MDRGRHRHLRANKLPSARPAQSRRSFAVNALAATGAAVSALNPAHAVQLGEIAIESTLGQPFSARVPVEIAAGEILGSACISAPPATRPELTGLPHARVTVPEAAQPGIYELRVTTEQPLYEPMYANLSRWLKPVKSDWPPPREKPAMAR